MLLVMDEEAAKVSWIREHQKAIERHSSERFKTELKQTRILLLYQLQIIRNWLVVLALIGFGGAKMDQVHL